MKKHEKCSICRDIPESCYAFWKGGELESDPLPLTESKLEIIGAPYFDDHTSHSHSLVKRCPECGTFYEWVFQYEYLVNGSEDEITVTRSSEKKVKNKIREMYKEIKLHESIFRRDALKIIKGLRKSSKPSLKVLNQASDLFYFNQLKGFDISFAVKDLVDALKKHTHKNEGCAAAFIKMSLHDFAKKNKINKKKVYSHLQNIKSQKIPPELEELSKVCK